MNKRLKKKTNLRCCVELRNVTWDSRHLILEPGDGEGPGADKADRGETEEPEALQLLGGAKK